MTTVSTTYLEMHSPRDLRPTRCSDSRFRIDEATTPQWQFNRFLYCTVGESWRWLEKRSWTEQQWRQYVESDRLRTFAAFYDGSPAGYFELRRDDEDGVQIEYFGLLPAFVGRGFGGALLTSALEAAWAMKPKRVWVHTCTLDHPAALANYQARGMKVYRVESKEVELHDAPPRPS
jgi:GNAT superfamily N-acetyltransferase